MKKITEIRVKDINVYRDGGTQEVIYEDGTKFYISNGLAFHHRDVYGEFPKPESKALSREVAVEVLLDVIHYYSTRYHSLRTSIEKPNGCSTN